jgi:hypothetical protein
VTWNALGASQAILTTLITESLELPLLLKSIVPFVIPVPDFTLILRFPAGLAKKPEREIVPVELAGLVKIPDAIGVVPSQRTTRKTPNAEASEQLTDPAANHVPVDPCATLGPSL